MKANYSRFIVALVALAASMGAAAQASMSRSEQGRTVTVTALTPSILRVDNTAKGQAPAPVQSVLELKAKADAAIVKGNKLSTADGLSAIFADDNILILKAKNKNSMVIDRGERDGVIELTNSGTGSFYGAGERGHRMNLRGDTLVMYNRQNYGYTGSDPRIKQMGITMPLFLSNDGYAIVFDDYAAAEMILSNPIKYISESKKPITYYYVAGESMAELTKNLTLLTGRQPLAPLWSLGYITSKYGYRTQAETEGVIDTLKSAGYPVDGIVLDLYWYGKEEDMGRLAWDPQQWPQPKQMLSRLAKKGVKLVPISQPYVLRNGRGVDNYNVLNSNGLLLADSLGKPSQEVTIWVGEGGMFDVSNPSTRQWLASRYDSLTAMGIAGWWGDLGEPEVHPQTAIHANGITARNYHNKYGNDWASIIAEMFAEKYPDRRLMTLMRGGTTGLQRQSVFPWSTDVSRSWGGLEPQVRIMLQTGLSGMGYMSSDLGGFAVDKENPYLPELYVRWVEAGLFSPVFRTHAQQFAEPYNYPQYADILLSLVKERYRWLPYNYTLAYENAAYGWPLARPLDFRSSQNGKYDNISDEYLWGDDVLVAPVMKEGATSRQIVLPEGEGWYDLRNPSKHYAGGSVIADYPAPLDVIPMFVRAGAVIPLADYAMDNSTEYRANRFEINCFPQVGVANKGLLFDDNRISPNTIAQRQYRLISFSGATTASEASFVIASEGSYPGAPKNIEMNFKIHTDKVPVSVNVDGKKAKFSYADGVIVLKGKYNPAKKSEIKILF